MSFATLERPRIAILASGDRESGGGGSTMARFIEGTQSGEVSADVGLVVCNNPVGTVGVYDHVNRFKREHGLEIPAFNISGKTHPEGRNERGQTDEEAAAICEKLALHSIDFVLTLGYMKQINGQLAEDWGWKPEYATTDPVSKGIYLARIINTHPGILPATADTYGIHASERAIELGLPHTAHTLHVVGTGIDTGPTVAEHKVKVETSDPQELFDEVQKTEKAKICSALHKYFVQRKAFLAA